MPATLISTAVASVTPRPDRRLAHSVSAGPDLAGGLGITGRYTNPAQTITCCQKNPDSGAFLRVSDGTRTHDRLDHNQELYQLSYAHRGTVESTSARRPRGSRG